MQVFVCLADGFEEIEALTAVDLLRRVGISTAMVSMAETLEVAGGHGIKVLADSLFADTDFADGNMLVLPGGKRGTDCLAEHEGLRELLLTYAREGKYLAAICAAPSVLGKHGLLAGKRAVCYPGFESYLTGALVGEESVVVDGTVITSRAMGTSTAFGLALVELLKGKEIARELSEAILAV